MGRYQSRRSSECRALTIRGVIPCIEPRSAVCVLRVLRVLCVLCVLCVLRGLTAGFTINRTRSVRPDPTAPLEGVGSVYARDPGQGPVTLGSDILPLRGRARPSEATGADLRGLGPLGGWGTGGPAGRGAPGRPGPLWGLGGRGRGRLGVRRRGLGGPVRAAHGWLDWVGADADTTAGIRASSSAASRCRGSPSESLSAWRVRFT
jgi:hypothetical protein